MNDLVTWLREHGEISGHLIDAADEIDHLTEKNEKMSHLLGLVAMEFKTDPMSVQCFDREAIVKPIIEEAW